MHEGENNRCPCLGSGWVSEAGGGCFIISMASYTISVSKMGVYSSSLLNIWDNTRVPVMNLRGGKKQQRCSMETRERWSEDMFYSVRWCSSSLQLKECLSTCRLTTSSEVVGVRVGGSPMKPWAIIPVINMECNAIATCELVRENSACTGISIHFRFYHNPRT